MPLLDFNSLVICNEDGSYKSLSDTLLYFSELGIKNFIVTQSFDLNVSSQSKIISDCKMIKETIAAARPRGVRVHFVPTIFLSPKLLKNPFIKRLKIRNSNTVFIQAPFFVNDHWIHSDLNYLLYRQKLRPVFTRFEKNLISCTPKFATSLFKTQKAAYCIDLNFFVSQKYEFRLHQAVTFESPIIPCVSNNLCMYGDMYNRFAAMRECIGDLAYFKICKHINTSCRSLWANFSH